jgi:aprataxin
MNVVELHPLKALQDTSFLEKVRAQVDELEPLLEKELIRLHKGQRQTLSANDEAKWTQDLKIGVHAKPSMTHLHIHIMSRDYAGEYMKTKKHYISFARFLITHQYSADSISSFFVDLDSFPLASDDPRKKILYAESLMKQDLVCWRCKHTFATMPSLQTHLAQEWSSYLSGVMRLDDASPEAAR